MIKVDSISETFDNKSEVSNTYLNIKPKEVISDQDINAYVGKVFEDARSVTEFDTYDNLLYDAFDRFEDEIDIDFSISEKTQALLEHFVPEKWKTINDTEKKGLIQELSTAIGEDLGLKDIPKLNISEYGDAYGCYDPKDNTITLNSQFLSDPVELVNTIAHETRHAYQFMRADKLETREDALFKVGNDNYISPIPLSSGGWLNYTDYYNQYVEVDARVFANKFMEAMV